jgi:hypothetical protein
MKAIPKKEFGKFFDEILAATSPEKLKAMKPGKKVTLAGLLEEHGIKLDLPKSLAQQLKPALELNLAERKLAHPACGACGTCGVCILCAEINYSAGVAAAAAVVSLV